ncbi:MAG: EAL domain-containing protein [Butyrivibrio sp.]|jgi:EAL domain-containing protein (putative c-di-GMP-specific phosphodiesterase class I)|nr:EAL domain-containing protein [Butyrivibrio sp.]
MLTDTFIRYNYTGEYAGILICFLALVAIFYSKPRKSFVFRYVVAGLFWSILSSVLQIMILKVANDPERLYDRYLFMILILGFLIAYNAVLYLVFAYVDMMSIHRRGQRKEFFMIYLVLALLYTMGAVIEVASGRIYIMQVGGIDVTHFIRFYSFAGIVCSIICFYASVTNKKDISRIVWKTVCIVVPFEIILLSVQILILSSHVIFTSLSYSLVFMFAYLLFHAEKYDEISGCQGINALNQYISKICGKKKFHILYVYFIFPSSGNMIDEDIDMGLKGIRACRSVEAISPKIRMFQGAEDRYVDVIERSSDKEARNYVNQIRGIFDWLKAEIYMPFNYMMIFGEVYKELDDPVKVRQFYDYISKRFVDMNNSYFYTTTREDLKEFQEYYEISRALKNIRNSVDENDERVLVYAQPIYSVEKDTFRVAEALMRLKIGDRIVTPDKFIPIAEQTGCIHMLSCIMVNKVCKAIEQLSEFYDFDAISINISSKELSNPTMYQDFLDIIEKYDIDMSKIRMEITETAMFENYDMAQRNMEILDKEGIQLYLDDFGTGYSSLERVINCPVKTIKFDKTLLYKSLDDNRMDDILTYMIEVFKKNGFVTLVEGVEDESQQKFSVDKGFDYIQGYHYAKPEPIEELRNYFSRKSKF